MFPSFIDILDIQSWWEVPSIAYFCSLFRTAFDLLDFDIEELEEALLTDGTEESASSLLTELIVRLLNGCLGNNDISAFNYQMYLRRLFRRKCQETGRYNPFNTDIDFQFLPLRTKVEILYALCDFRLDAEDVFELFKNLEAESLRVEPLGWDDNGSAYWYFYGTRLYREDNIKKPKRKRKKGKKRDWFYGDDWLDDDEPERVWQVVCFTEEDWAHLTEKFSKATSKIEKELHRSLSQNFLPEIPRLFREKEKLQRKRLLELPRRTSSRVLQKIKQKEEENKQSTHDVKDEDERKETSDLARENRAKRRNLLRSKSVTSDSSEDSEAAKDEMPQKVLKQHKGRDEKKIKVPPTNHKGEPPPEPPVKTGRKTNNSLASATGQILIPDNDEPLNSTRKKLKTSQIFSQTDEDIQTDMYKVLEQLTAHEDAWPFMDPVEEEYAPNYYAVIRRPMDLKKMEERLDSGHYTDFSMFKADFKLIVNNCRLYNGQDNEYTIMVDNLQTAFDRLTEKYMHRLSSSDEEIAVEYQLPTPSRKHKLKCTESVSHHKRKKRKSHSDAGEPKSSTSDIVQQEEKQSEEILELEIKKPKESHKNKDGKVKKKRKGHHRHGKHSKNHKKNSLRSEHSDSHKSKHVKKQKHAKNKDGKKSKQKKKKSKHHELETNENLKRTISHESLESSNRSRSASPLPSIHSPTPSPTELDQSESQQQHEDPDFSKDKYDKIKERRRNAAKEAWDSLFEYKQKVDKQKQNLNIPEKDKNQKLRETIEKLKAKNEKYKDSAIFNNLFVPNHGVIEKISELSNTNETLNKDSEDVDDDIQKNKSKKGQKKNTAKNESASEALEQAVKDISKWLDDAPKSSTLSSPSNSPAQTISTEEQDNSRLDDEFSQGEKSSQTRKELSRKRLLSREPKFLKRREIQRTIERLQPGKSKGNLLTNISTKAEKMEEVITLGPLNKVRDSVKADESSPKLSLGSVLPTVEFTLGSEHAFGNNDENNSEEQNNPSAPVSEKIDKEIDKPAERKTEIVQVQSNKKDVEVETESPSTTKPSQEKATPNLSAWFKAFGAPKNTPIVSSSVKKKVDDTDTDEKPAEVPVNENKPVASPKNITKYDSPTDPETPILDGGDSPLLNVSVTPRQRRTSTGSSVSERSSFSQDLDSPRHQMSHTSPLLHSPASPRTEDFQKITYPIINGTVRAGFYHDTTSIKSSPEKSCSPREAPQSPYSPYSQHVYASNNATGSSTPNYFIDHSKSPLSTFSQNPTSFYDTPKPPVVNKTGRSQDEYATLSPESYQQNQYTNQFTHAYSPYKQTPPSTFSQIQHVTQQSTTTSVASAAPAQITADSKTALFPVKKRTYNEPEQTSTNSKTSDAKDMSGTTQNKNEYQKMTQALHTISSLSTTSVDDIALALSEKSEMSKLNNYKEKLTPDYTDRRMVENRENIKYENNEPANDKKETAIPDSNKPISIISKDNIDMVNMGYLNSDSAQLNSDRRHNGDSHEDFNARDITKSNTISPQKVYDVDAIALNLGINPQMSKSKSNTNSSNIPPAHSQHSDINLSQIMAHAHHNQYDPISSGQTVSSFSINDIELANKKLFACNVPSTSAPLDYGNWKMTNQIRKQDILPSDYSTSYNVNSAEKLKTDLSAANASSINFNKSAQHQQYNTYNVPRTNTQRAQDVQQNLPAELRIPNPRGLLKNDHINVSSSIGEADLMSKNIDNHAKSQKADKLVQSHSLVTSNPYKTSYSNHSSIPLESLRNLPTIPQMLERYTNDERYLSTFASSSTGLYHEKQFQMAQMFNKTMSPEVHPTNSSVSMQPPVSITKDGSTYKSSTHSIQPDIKSKNKRKKASETKTQIVGSQSYHTPGCGSDVLSSVKTSMLPGSAFNFGTTPNMSLGSSIYGDNSGFSIEDFRNSTASQLMAANYMVAAVARQQQNSVDSNSEKLVKPAHQNSSHSTGSFPYIGHSQVRAGYPFVSTDTPPPLYHRYLQQRQEELLRQTGAQIMGLYPSGYPASLGVRQPYDSINRPSWL